MEVKVRISFNSFLFFNTSPIFGLGKATNKVLMELFHAFTALIVLSAIFGYINERFLKLPISIGLMIIALVMSIGMVFIGTFSPNFLQTSVNLVRQIDFHDVLMDVMLSFLLFAGALHVDVKTLSQERWPIMIFASIGVLMSTFIVGTLTYYLLIFLGLPIPYILALLFGALISPTDPIAVLAILKKTHLPKKLEVKIAGESLFNDGIAVVIFLTILAIAKKGIDKVSFGEIAFLFLEETGGGLLLGFLLGLVGYYLLKSIDAYVVEVIITLAMVVGGYALANYFHFSGPLAVVIAGLMMSDKGRTEAMSDTTREYLDKFWEMLDEILNSVLFVLMGLEILAISFKLSYIWAGLISFLVVLLSRLISVGIPISLMRLTRDFIPNTLGILTWGGLRGGISVALALSLPSAMSRDLIVAITYIVVILSILLQGLTIGLLVKRVNKSSSATAT